MSATTIPDLWPTDIKVDVVEPIAILRAQEVGLTRKTHGLLRAEVRSLEQSENDKKEESRVIHSLDLIAPSLHEYRVTLMTAVHLFGRFYPVLVRSRVFDSGLESSSLPVPIVGGIEALTNAATAATLWKVLYKEPEPHPEYRRAATQDEFISLVGEVLQSVWVRSLIQSLIAQSNAVTKKQEDGNSSSGVNAPTQS